MEGAAPGARDSLEPSVDAVRGDEDRERALEGEGAALDADARVTNSEGATFTRGSGGSVLVTSGGFRGASRGTYASLVVNPVADDADGKKRSGYHWAATRHLAELESATAVGKEATRRTLRKLGATKIASPTR